MSQEPTGKEPLPSSVPLLRWGPRHLSVKKGGAWASCDLEVAGVVGR